MTQKNVEKDNIYIKIQQLVPFDGWNKSVITKACLQLNLPIELAEIYYPNGPYDIISQISDEINTKMEEKLKTMPLNEMKIRDKITQALIIKLELYQPIKMLIRKNVQFCSLPKNNVFALKELYKTVDRIWKAIGDKSVYFDYYTKRMTLATVYTSTILYWLNDESDNFIETKRFIDRRIEDVMKIGKIKKNPLEFIKKSCKL